MLIKLSQEILVSSLPGKVQGRSWSIEARVMEFSLEEVVLNHEKKREEKDARYTAGQKPSAGSQTLQGLINLFKEFRFFFLIMSLDNTHIATFIILLIKRLSS